MRAANEVNLRMAPLTPDHHFYIDQGANAHVRLVLLAVGTKLVEAGRLDAARRRHVPALQRAAGAHRQRRCARRPGRSSRPAGRSATPRRQVHPRDWVGTVTPSQLAFPYLVNWGYPERFHRGQAAAAGEGDDAVIEGIAGSPGVIEGTARVVMTVDEFDEVRDGDILVCQMTNPAWVVLFTKIAALVTDTGGTTSHPAVLSREFGIPAVIGTSVATKRIATGDRIRVDGTNGRVEVLASAEDAADETAAAETAAIGR